MCLIEIQNKIHHRKQLVTFLQSNRKNLELIISLWSYLPNFYFMKVYQQQPLFFSWLLIGQFFFGCIVPVAAYMKFSMLKCFIRQFTRLYNAVLDITQEKVFKNEPSKIS